MKRFVGLHKKSITNLTLDEGIEFEDCSNIILAFVFCNCHAKENLAFSFLNCKNFTISRCGSVDPITLNDDGGEAHGFIVNKCSNFKFISCKSIVHKPDWMEDHFNCFESQSIIFNNCIADGPIRKTGTAFCIDHGSQNISIVNSSGINLNGGTGITIADGLNHKLDNILIKGCSYAGVSISDEWYPDAKVSATLKDLNIFPQDPNGEKVYIRKSPNVKITLL